MELYKRLVILTGKAGQGTALIEQNGLGAFITLQVFSLPDLTKGEYALGVKTATRVYRRALGSLGRIKARFSLEEDDYAAVHLVLFRTADEEVVLYGTSDARKMWESNLMDGLRGDGLEQTTATDTRVATGKAAQDFSYSERKVEDYFLPIDPSRYYDNAVADVNYFDFAKSPFSGMRDTAFAAEEAEQQDAPQADGQKQAQRETAAASAEPYGSYDAPSELERRYLQNRFAGAGMREREARAPLREDESAQKAHAAPQAAQAPQADESVPPKIKKASQYTAQQAVAAAKTGASYFETVKEQIEKLFTGGEKFTPLENALPGTRWVKVDYDGNGRYYVVGLIGANPDYIAYGVPGKYGDTPPLLDGADFVPLSPDNPAADGFWVLFQSAQTGEEIVRA